MRKLTKMLFLCLISVGLAQAVTYHDKTFLMPRADNDNLSMMYTAWHRLIHEKGIHEDDFGGAFQIVPFYQDSTNEKALGLYFGAENGSYGIQDFIKVNSGQTGSAALDSVEVMHVRDGSCTLLDTILLRPSRDVVGIRVDYKQKLDRFIPNMYVQFELPLVCVTQSLGATSTGGSATQSFGGSTYSLMDYFNGNVESTTSGYAQQKLTHAKFGGSHSRAGLADIEVKLGYNFMHKDTKHLAFYGAAVIPTGNHPDGEFAFEPMVGNGGHVGVGCGLDYANEIWAKDNKSVDLGVVANYKYLFSGTEKRTLGFKDPEGNSYPFGHYMLAGKQGQGTVFPFANVLTRDLVVTPGSSIDVLVNSALHWREFIFELGYEFFAKEAEAVSVKSWDNNKYGVVNYDFATTSLFDYSSDSYLDDESGDPVALNSGYLEVDRARTPSQVTHKVHGSVGCAFEDWSYPVFISVGGSYEFVSGRNSALQNYAFWGKLGLNF
jgi:hypothetical protein